MKLNPYVCEVFLINYVTKSYGFCLEKAESTQRIAYDSQKKIMARRSFEMVEEKSLRRTEIENF